MVCGIIQSRARRRGEPLSDDREVSVMLRISGRTLLRRTVSALAVGALGVTTLIATAGPRTSYTVFKGTFDSSFASLQAEVGHFYSWFSQSAAVHIVGDGAGGNALLLDDTAQTAGSGVVIAGAFDNNKPVSIGTFTWSFEVIYGQLDIPFEAGIVVDSPGSDFIPATGPDSQGNLLAFGKKTGDSVAVGVPFDVNITLSRDQQDEDWNYSVTIIERGANVVGPQVQGRVAGTAGNDIVGIAFQKQSGKQGQVFIDDIHATTDTAGAKGI